MQCSSPKTIFTNDLCKPVFEHTKRDFLERLEAKKRNYSIVIFTTVFEGEKITISNNGNVLYNDSIKDIGNGFSKAIRVNNRFDVEIKDIEKSHSFKLKSKYLKDYKFVYLKKDMFKVKSYTLTYSNTLCGFK